MIVQTEVLARNLAALRRANGFTLEEVAVRVGTTRQAVGKWELGESLPDLPHTAALAELYGVTVDALISHDESTLGYPVPPKGKHIFGIITVGERGEIVLPNARGRYSVCNGVRSSSYSATKRRANAALRSWRANSCFRTRKKS